MNRIRFKREEHPFSEGNVATAIQAFEDIPIDGLVRTSEKVYDLLLLGKAMEQTVGDDTKSFTLDFIDWRNPANNVFHLAEEFAYLRKYSPYQNVRLLEASTPQVKDVVRLEDDYG